MNQWQIGDVKITRIVELEVAGGTKFILPDATPEACRDIEWLKPHFMTEQGKLIRACTRWWSIRAADASWSIRASATTRNATSELEPSADVVSLGPRRGVIRAIDRYGAVHASARRSRRLNTMLVDGHCADLPNARYLIAQQEWRYWDEHGEDAQYGSVLADSVRPVIEAGLVDFVSMEHRLCDEVWLEPTPGHTAGHVSVHTSRRGHRSADHRRLHSPSVSDRAHRLDQLRRFR
jgi:hypothetical protein